MDRQTAAVFAFFLIASCGSQPDVIPPGASPAPAHLVVEAWAPHASETLAAGKRALEGTALADRVPEDPPSVLASVLEDGEPIARLAAGDGPLGLVIVGPRARVAWIAKMRALPDADRARLRITPASVPWAHLVSVRDRPSRAVAAVAGPWLVVADDRATLDATMPYLVRTVTRRRATGGPTSVYLRFADDAAAATLRPALDAKRRSLVRGARDAARSERQRHRLPPTIGEPEVLIDELDRVVGRWIAWLRDVGAGEAVAAIEDDAIVVDATGTVAPGTPLGRVLSDESPGAARGIAGAPAQSAITWSGASSPEARRDTTRTWIAAATRTSGARLTAPERVRWQTTLEALDVALGDARAVSLGTTDSGARAVSMSFDVADPGRATTAIDGLASALVEGHLAEVVTSLAGCVPSPRDPSAPSPSTSAARTDAPSIARPDGDAGRVVCVPDPARRDSMGAALGWSVRARAGGIAWGRDVDQAVAMAASARESRETPVGSSIAGDDPDAARWLDAQRDAFLALAAAPSGLVRLARMRGGGPPRDRALVAIARTDRGLRLRARVPVRAALSTFVLARMLGADE